MSQYWRGFSLSPFLICSFFYTTLALNTINRKWFIKVNPLLQIWMSLGRCASTLALARLWGGVGGGRGQPRVPWVPERVPRCWDRGSGWQGCSSGQTPTLSIHTHTHSPVHAPSPYILVRIALYTHPLGILSKSHTDPRIHPLCASPICKLAPENMYASHTYFTHVPCKPINAPLYASPCAHCPHPPYAPHTAPTTLCALLCTSHRAPTCPPLRSWYAPP